MGSTKLIGAKKSQFWQTWGPSEARYTQKNYADTKLHGNDFQMIFNYASQMVSEKAGKNLEVLFIKGPI